jgi:glutamine amidotransferase
MQIVIIDYGAGNIQSVKFALERLGYTAVLSDDAQVIREADKVIFPGVGEASSAMQKLKEHGLDSVIPQLTQPVLGICLGMQLMCAFSEEGQTPGLGIFDVDVVRFTDALKVPQIGWNQIRELRTPLFNGVPDGGHIYLVHSYYAPLCEETIAVTDYGIAYSSAVCNDNFWGVQFHPEKSSAIGEQILRNFITL